MAVEDGFGIMLRSEGKMTEICLPIRPIRGRDVRTPGSLRPSALGSGLHGSDLRRADLPLSNVDRAVLNNADLRDSRLRAVESCRSAQWIGADTRDTNFAGTYQLRRHVVDENYLWGFRDSNRFSAFGFDHASVEALVAEDWGLPYYLVKAIAGHHAQNGEHEVEPAMHSELKERPVGAILV